MLSVFLKGTSHIYLSCGVTDFRKQTEGLVAIVTMGFQLDPFQDNCVFLFCNRRRDSIKVLRYDKNGFILANKKLLEKMKFQWPMKVSEAKKISNQQAEWLLQGLEIEPKKVLRRVERNSGNICF